MKYTKHIPEIIVVIVILVGLTYFMFPKFLAAQNINTPRNFPDPNFHVEVEKFMEVETGGSFSEINAEQKNGTLSIHDNGVMSLKGIEYFPHVQKISCSYNPLRAVDLSKNVELTEVLITGCDLKELDLSHNPIIQKLWLDNNLLENLDLRHQTQLKELRCSGNRLQFLNLNYCPELSILVCNQNQIKELDVSNNAKLKELRCYDNQLTVLDLSGNPELEQLNCSKNNLQIIRFPNRSALQFIQCQDNQLETIDLAPCLDLEAINLINNGFRILPDFSLNSRLQVVQFQGNRLEEEQCGEIKNLHEKLGDLQYLNQRTHKKGFSYQPQANGVIILCSTE